MLIYIILLYITFFKISIPNFFISNVLFYSYSPNISSIVRSALCKMLCRSYYWLHLFKSIDANILSLQIDRIMCTKATIGRPTLNENIFSVHYTNERRLCLAAVFRRLVRPRTVRDIAHCKGKSNCLEIARIANNQLHARVQSRNYRRLHDRKDYYDGAHKRLNNLN